MCGAASHEWVVTAEPGWPVARIRSDGPAGAWRLDVSRMLAWPARDTDTAATNANALSPEVRRHPRPRPWAPATRLHSRASPIPVREAAVRGAGSARRPSFARPPGATAPGGRLLRWRQVEPPEPMLDAARTSPQAFRSASRLGRLEDLRAMDHLFARAHARKRLHYSRGHGLRQAGALPIQAASPRSPPARWPAAPALGHSSCFPVRNRGCRPSMRFCRSSAGTTG